jgi:prepilin-type N-terminal cleavage/methylation domain-containing protein
MIKLYNENGFSLVELAVAAAVAVALAAVTISVIQGTAADVESSALVAKAMEECSIHTMLSPWTNVLSC